MYEDKAFLNVLLAIWQLPQILVALFILPFFKNKSVYTNPHNNITVLNVDTEGVFKSACFSLGPFIFTKSGVSDSIKNHETGHSVQSTYLGVLYLFAVAIPSVCRFWYKKLAKKSNDWYHSGYPEHWADILGGVDRSQEKSS